MPMILTFSATGRPDPGGETVAVQLLEPVSWRVTGFLELSQMLTWVTPVRALTLSTYLTWSTPGTVNLDALTGQVLTLDMTAGPLPVESFNWSSERGQGTRLDVTVIGDARALPVPAITVTAGESGGTFAARGTLPEWEHDLGPDGQQTTTLHATDRTLVRADPLPELVPWEERGVTDAAQDAAQAEQIARIPASQRDAARTDPRRMPVDAVVLAALATVPHRLLAVPPFPGYDLRAGGNGPTYSTAGRTALDVVTDIWGTVGIQAGWEDGYLVIRPPGPTGDVLLPAPVGSVRTERITLDAPRIEVTGGPASDPDGNPDPRDPTDPRNSPDPDEREGGAPLEFGAGVSPTPVPGTLSATAVPLSWQAVPGASQYILERVEGPATPYALWSRVAITTATRHTDDTARPLTTYTYRLRVNATATAGTNQNVLYAPSDPAQVTTPPPDLDQPPGPVTGLTGYYRSETAVGVRWTAPDADPPAQPLPRRDPADRYRVQVRLGGALLRDVTTPQTYVVVDGLPVGANLTVAVTAINGTVAGEAATATVQLVNLPPGAPADLDLDAEGKAVAAAWNLATGATAHEVQWARSPVGRPVGAWSAALTVPVGTATQDGSVGERGRAVLTGVPRSTRVAVRVRGTNALGAGAWAEAIIITPSAPPQPEPDVSAAAFERAATQTLNLSRQTDTTSERTTIWKRLGRVSATQTQVRNRVSLLNRAGGVSTAWRDISTTTTRHYYGISAWPLTLTATVTETVHYDVQQPGREMGRERERVHQEWSPQGWLNLRRTERTRAAWIGATSDPNGSATNRQYVTQNEAVMEQWQPAGEGLWLYRRVESGVTPTPVYLRDAGGDAGDWDTLESASRPSGNEVTISEQAPPQATLPRRADNEDIPPLPRNTTSATLDRYPLDAPWFEVSAPPATGGNSGPELAGPDGPGPPPGPNEPTPTPAGSGDVTGAPEPDSAASSEPRQPITHSFTAPIDPADAAGGNGATIQTTIPWVRTAAGLARYAAMLAQQGGPRLRITRTYLLPVPPPSLDQALSVSATGRAGEFALTVVTETR